jgi:fructoselysine-6-P-deglycase FrlB-like protein
MLKHSAEPNFSTGQLLWFRVVIRFSFSCRPTQLPLTWWSLQRISGERVHQSSRHQMSGRLPVLPPDHPDTDAICLIQSLYGLAIRLARHRGIDADQPRHLRKITQTR